MPSIAVLDAEGNRKSVPLLSLGTARKYSSRLTDSDVSGASGLSAVSEADGILKSWTLLGLSNDRMSSRKLPFEGFVFSVRDGATPIPIFQFSSRGTSYLSR